jgi:hypothetical protein
LVRDPNMRLPNARAAFAELAPVLRGQLMSTHYAPPPPRLHSGPIVQPKPQSSGWGCVFGIVAVLAIVAGAAIWGIYVLVKKGEEVADDAVTAIASAANSAAQADGGGAPPPMASASASASASTSAAASSSSDPDEPTSLLINTIGDAKLHDESDRQLNLGLDKKMAACAAKEKRKKLAASFQVQVKPDGHVASVQRLTGETGPDMQCFADTIKTMTFSTGGMVMLTITSAK